MGDRAIEQNQAKGRDIGLRLSVVARLMRQDFDRRIASLGVTRSQWTMIVVVARQPGATQRQIAEILEMSEASAGRLIDRLCADGYLVRAERDDDRRARSVTITEKTQPLLECLADIGGASQKHVFRNFSDEELEQFGHLLDKLYANLQTGPGRG